MKIESLSSYKYAKKVVDGKILTCNYIKQAAERFLSDLKRKDLYFDVEEVVKFNKFCEKIVCVPELGHPSPLPAPHAFWLHQIHGFRYKKTGLRRFTLAYVQVARKNWKTFYAAVESLYEMILGRDKTLEILIGANDREQAIICTDMIGKIIKASPELCKLIESKKLEAFTYRKKTTEIVFDAFGRLTRAEAMPRDPGDGRGGMGIVDEFHEAKDSTLLETIKSGQGQRQEPLTIVITSPGHNKAGPCFTELRHTSLGVLSGAVEQDRHLAIVFELDEEEEWDKIEMMEKSNPMIPYSKTLKNYLADRIQEAKVYGGSKAVNIKIKNSGIWVDQSSVWIPTDRLKQNRHGIEERDLIGQDCFPGIDLSSTTDLTAFAEFYPDVNGKKVLWVKFFVPESKIEKQSIDQVDYLKWTEEGWIGVHGGNAIDMYEVTNEMVDRWQDRNVVSIGYDPKYFNQAVAPVLNERGYLDLCNRVNQGFTGMSGAVNQLQAWLLENQMDLMKNPVLIWCFQNVELKTGDQGDRIPSKAKSNGRIDGVSASLTAISNYLKHISNEDGGFFVERWK